jgi:hypothetical protein
MAIRSKKKKKITKLNKFSIKALKLSFHKKPGVNKTQMKYKTGYP